MVLKHLPIKAIKNLISSVYWQGYYDGVDSTRGERNRFFGDNDARILFEEDNIKMRQKEAVNILRKRA